MVRGVAGSRRVVQEEWLLRRDRLCVFDELECLVGDVHGEVVTLVRGFRLIRQVVVVEEVGIPLVGLGSQEPIGPLEAPAARPVSASRGKVHFHLRAQVPFAHHVSVPSCLRQDLGDGAVLGGDDTTGVREADRGLSDARHGVAGVVSAC